MNDLSKLIQTLIKSILISIVLAVIAGYIYRPDSYYYRDDNKKFYVSKEETHYHQRELYYNLKYKCRDSYRDSLDRLIYIENPFNKEIAAIIFIISTSVLTLYLNKKQNKSN